MPEVAQTYALPQDVRDAGVRHWGYHGISYDYISRQVPKFAPQARRVIAAHLGGGASMCAMLDGRSIETTMGFGGVSGLPMATRSGDVPPDVLFYLLRSKLFDDAALEKMLYERAGLLGLSGISGDMRVLQESADPRAVAAVEYFVYAMTKYAGAYAAVLGGLDAFVFTAGIGEHSAPVRAALCAQAGVARRQAGRAGERIRRTAHLPAGQRRVGLGHSHQRGTDDRPAHAGAHPPLEDGAAYKIPRKARRSSATPATARPSPAATRAAGRSALGMKRSSKMRGRSIGISSTSATPPPRASMPPPSWSRARVERCRSCLRVGPRRSWYWTTAARAMSGVAGCRSWARCSGPPCAACWTVSMRAPTHSWL